MAHRFSPSIKSYLTLSLLALITVLSGCDRVSQLFGLRKEYQVTIQTAEGKYVSADEFKEQKLLADRLSVKKWEVFTVVEFSDDQIALRSSSDRFVAPDNFNGGVLAARDLEVKEPQLFERLELGNGFVALKDHRGNFLRLNGSLLVSDGTQVSQAVRLKIQRYNDASVQVYKDHQLFYLFTGLFFVALSIVLFQLQDNRKWAVGTLLVGGVLIRVFVVELSDYLHWWDEQYHALVAKNMMDHPFKPMLFANPVLPYDKFSWVAGHVWLHKQPLFLWQMALSMKLFGVNLTAMRLPSLIMSALVIPIIYRMGKIGFSEKTGFYGALLYTLSFFGLRLASGTVHTDHNDTAFFFYVAASFWAWFEYESAPNRSKWKWAIMVGIFTGGAVLNKWLTGLLAFLGWGLLNVFVPGRRRLIKSHMHLAISVLTAVLVFLPWQLYILSEFPEVSLFEYSHNSKHLFESVEGHGEDYGFHFLKVTELYGVGWPVLFLSLLLFIWKLPRTAYWFMILISVVVIYVFFMFATTKMIAFTYCVASLVFLVFGFVLEKFFDWIVVNPALKSRKIYTVIYTSIVLGSISYFNFNISGIEEELTMRDKDRDSFIWKRKDRTRLFKKLPSLVPDSEKTVLFNCKQADAVQVMFLTDFLDAHEGFPTDQQYSDMKSMDISIAYFDDARTPDFLKNDLTAIPIKESYE